MKNSDKPINPIWMTQNGDDSYIPLKEGQKTGFEKLFTGLSKREYFAAMAMQGLLSSRGLQEALNLDKQKWEDFAIEMADRLLTSLETK